MHSYTEKFTDVSTGIALMMEAASTSETSVNLHQTTRCNNQEDGHFQDECGWNTIDYLHISGNRLQTTWIQIVKGGGQVEKGRLHGQVPRQTLPRWTFYGLREVLGVPHWQAGNKMTVTAHKRDLCYDTNGMEAHRVAHKFGSVGELLLFGKIRKIV
jgi:hypothetical protein